MTAKADYTPEDWAALVRAPLIAGMAISLADPGGPIELTKESMAAMRSVLEAVGGEQTELVAAVRSEFEAQAKARQNPAAGYKPSNPQDLLDELARVNGVVTATGTPAEAEGFRELLRMAARRAADAAKEGGFMGFGAEQVSAGEQRMLEQIDAALAAPAG